jgi:hypothetical protein
VEAGESSDAMLPSQEQLVVISGQQVKGPEETELEEKLMLDINPKQLSDCPECETKLVKQEGCILCPTCGFSACHN